MISYVVVVIQEVLQTPEPGELVGPEDVSIPVIELPSLTAIEQMIQTGQSHCSVNGVVLQNGVTTTQVQSVVTNVISSHRTHSSVGILKIVFQFISVILLICACSVVFPRNLLH